MFLNFNNGNLITFKLRIDKTRQDNDYSFHTNELYKYDVNVLLTIHNRNVLKEQNFTCTLIPCRT